MSSPESNGDLYDRTARYDRGTLDGTDSTAIVRICINCAAHYHGSSHQSPSAGATSSSRGDFARSVARDLCPNRAKTLRSRNCGAVSVRGSSTTDGSLSEAISVLESAEGDWTSLSRSAISRSVFYGGGWVACHRRPGFSTELPADYGVRYSRWTGIRAGAGAGADPPFCGFRSNGDRCRD